MFLGGGRKPEYPEENPEAQGGHANSTQMGQKQESNPQPQRSEANMPNTKPPCPPFELFLNYFIHLCRLKASHLCAQTEKTHCSVLCSCLSPLVCKVSQEAGEGKCSFCFLVPLSCGLGEYCPGCTGGGRNFPPSLLMHSSRTPAQRCC